MRATLFSRSALHGIRKGSDVGEHLMITVTGQFVINHKLICLATVLQIKRNRSSENDEVLNS